MSSKEHEMFTAMRYYHKGSICLCSPREPQLALDFCIVHVFHFFFFWGGGGGVGERGTQITLVRLEWHWYCCGKMNTLYWCILLA